ncbi:MAG TPA: TetR/AcrR family transcriptional regulator [Thermoanaerobaculia bacterium]|nr:TetR/AcrR family transcriptional regulator [Thermoanaerobaculia bacterium]
MTITAGSVRDVFSGTGKRERILRAAVDVFAQTGYHNSKVSEVARAAGVADGTIYLYFEGKEDLLITIFREQSRAFLAGLAGELERISDPRVKIRRIVEYHLETLGADRPLAVVLQVELRQSLKFISLVSHEELRDYLEVIRGVVDEGMRAGAFRKIEHPQIVANAIFGVLDEMVSTWILSEKESMPAEHGETIAGFVLRGLE